MARLQVLHAAGSAVSAAVQAVLYFSLYRRAKSDSAVAKS